MTSTWISVSLYPFEAISSVIIDRSFKFFTDLPSNDTILSPGIILSFIYDFSDTSFTIVGINFEGTSLNPKTNTYITSIADRKFITTPATKTTNRLTGD